MHDCRHDSPLCHYGTQSRAVKTPLSTAPPLTLTEKCQNPKAERDHNKLITNRKWLHYGLKDRRECSLVTALTQIHIPAGFRESQVSPADCAPQPLPPPRGTAQGVWGCLMRVAVMWSCRVAH